jgi:hypothetical protein
MNLHLHPAAQVLSVTYVANIMRSALGDSESWADLPPGCPALLQNCAEFLVEKFDANLAAHHADLMRGLMRFMIIAPTISGQSEAFLVVSFDTLPLQGWSIVHSIGTGNLARRDPRRHDRQ